MQMHLTRPLAAGLAFALAGIAAADEPNPYYIGVNQAFGYNSNLYSSEVDRWRADVDHEPGVRYRPAVPGASISTPQATSATTTSSTRTPGC